MQRVSPPRRCRSNFRYGLLAVSVLIGRCGIGASAIAAESFQVHASGHGAVRVVAPDGGAAEFAPELVVLRSATDPGLEMRWGQFRDPALRLNDTGSIYNVLTWGPKATAVRTTQHVEDGFNPATDRGYGPGRTADLFAAGQRTVLRGNIGVETMPLAGRNGNEGAAPGGSQMQPPDARATAIRLMFPERDGVRVHAEVDVPADGTAPRLRFTATVRDEGWYSFGYAGAPSAPPSEVTELWQPLIWNERRFPEASFLEAAYRCPLPTTLVTQHGVTVGVVADPTEYPFQPLPNFDNSRFGVAVRNAQGLAQPMLFAPMLGGAGSHLRAGESRTFAVRLYVAKAGLSTAYERLARQLYGFGDVRHNALGSLNATFDRMLDFGRSEYARFNADLRGFAYDTDVPGAVKNVSALHPLSLSLVTDDPAIYRQLARPLMEFFVSRERFLFATDPKIKGQSTSSRLGGLGAPLTEYAALYAMSGRRTPFFRDAAVSLFGKDRVLNLEGKTRGDNFSNALALYRATGDRRWLEAAMQDADAYLQRRVATRQTDFSDPDSRGLFFWTAFTPQWVELFELYEETHQQRFLEAAHQGARAYAQYVWLSPRIPSGEVAVNQGGLAPAYRTGPRFPRISVAEETVPAWRVSEIGLTSESAPTSKGARGIFLACYAPWMLRIGALTQDAFLRDIARSAIIGRYTSFPGYHLNTARNTAYEKPDFARRGKDELNSATSIHYNHIWPHIALVFDYLVADVFAKSGGRIDFPARYAEGYGYLQQRVYGDRPGRIYDTDGYYLWMPPGVVAVDNPELDYLVARAPHRVAIALTNQSKISQRAVVGLNSEHIRLAGSASRRVAVWEGNRHVRDLPLAADGRVEVAVAAEGITTLVATGVEPKVAFQDELLQRTQPLPERSVCDLGWRGARAVTISFGGPALTSVYVYLPDFEREVAQATLKWRQGDGSYREASDNAFPFDYTIEPAGVQDVEFIVTVHLKDGRTEQSPVGRVRLRQDTLTDQPGARDLVR